MKNRLLVAFAYDSWKLKPLFGKGCLRSFLNTVGELEIASTVIVSRTRM